MDGIHNFEHRSVAQMARRAEGRTPGVILVPQPKLKKAPFLELFQLLYLGSIFEPDSNNPQERFFRDILWLTSLMVKIIIKA